MLLEISEHVSLWNDANTLVTGSLSTIWQHETKMLVFCKKYAESKITWFGMGYQDLLLDFDLGTILAMLWSYSQLCSGTLALCLRNPPVSGFEPEFLAFRE